MPNDYRRFTGPDVSFPYSQFVPGSKKTPEELRASLVNSQGKRLDGRSLNESRPLSVVRTGIVSQAKGSAYLEIGNTKVICSVFAPREIPKKDDFSRLGQVYVETRYAMYACPGVRRSPAPEADERQLSTALKQALQTSVMRQMFPNYQVDVIVLILQNDGGCLGASVTAAGLALVDAAVPMYDVVCATTLAVLGDKIFMDPTSAEEQACQNNMEGVEINHGVVTLALMPSYDKICDFNQIGSMNLDCVTKAMDLLRTECTESIVPAVESCLLKGVQTAIKLKKKEKEYGQEREEALKKSVNDLRHKLNIS